MTIHFALHYYTIWLTCAEYIQLSSYIINYCFRWGEFSLSTAKISNQNYHFGKKLERILAFSFIIVFFFFFIGLKIYFRDLTLHLVKRNMTDYYRTAMCRRKSQPSLIFSVATSNLLTIEKPLKC